MSLSKRTKIYVFSTVVVLVFSFISLGFATGKLKISADANKTAKQEVPKQKVEFAENEFIVKYKTPPSKEVGTASAGGVKIKSSTQVFGSNEVGTASAGISPKPASSGSDLSKYYKVTTDNIITDSEKRDITIQVKNSPEKKDVIDDFSYQKHLNVLKTIQADPNVEKAQLNYKLKASWIPNDPNYSAASIPSNNGLWGLKRIGLESTWDRTKGKNVVVAVIDTGVDYTHEDLKDNILKDTTGEIIGYNFTSTESKDYMDRAGHGTHVSGTIAAVGNNNIGVVGVAPEAKIMPIKCLDDYGGGFTDNLALGVKYAADHGAQVANLSWGGRGENPVINEALDYAYSKGVVLVAAAGNDSDDALDFAPANSNKVITVGSMNTHNSSGGLIDMNSSFSNYGPKIDVVAPGERILSTVPKGVTSIEPYNLVGDNYAYLSGTSMATPHVVGLAALLLAEHPDWNKKDFSDIRNAIDQTALDLKTATWKDAYLTNLSGKDDIFGFGLIAPSDASDPILTSAPKVPVANLNDFQKSYQESFKINGTATGDGFTKYTVEYRPVGEIKYKKLLESTRRITSASLAEFNKSSSQLKDGFYYLRLSTISIIGTGKYSQRTSTVAKYTYIANKQIKGFPLALDVPLDADPIVTKLDGKNQNLIVTSYDRTQVYSTKDYRLVWEKAFENNCLQFARPLVSDLDKDGKQEVIMSLSCRNKDMMITLDYTGKEKWRYDPNDGSTIVSSAFYFRDKPGDLVTDINNDGKDELIIVKKNFENYSYNMGDFATKIKVVITDSAGKVLSEKEVNNEKGGNLVKSGLAAADINNDGNNELILTQASFREDTFKVSSYVEVFDKNLNQIWKKTIADLATYSLFVPGASYAKSSLIALGVRDLDTSQQYLKSGVVLLNSNGNEVSRFFADKTYLNYEVAPVKTSNSALNSYYLYTSFGYGTTAGEKITAINLADKFGKALFSWPYKSPSSENYFGSSILAADLDGDKQQEIVLEDRVAPKLFLLNEGRIGGYFPTSAYFSGVVVTDIDEDGKMDLVTQCSEGPFLHHNGYSPHFPHFNGINAFGFSGQYKEGDVYWPMAGHDLQNTNSANLAVASPSSTSTPDLSKLTFKTYYQGAWKDATDNSITVKKGEHFTLRVQYINKPKNLQPNTAASWNNILRIKKLSDDSNYFDYDVYSPNGGSNVINFNDLDDPGRGNFQFKVNISK